MEKEEIDLEIEGKRNSSPDKLLTPEGVRDFNNIRTILEGEQKNMFLERARRSGLPAAVSMARDKGFW